MFQMKHATDVWRFQGCAVELHLQRTRATPRLRVRRPACSWARPKSSLAYVIWQACTSSMTGIGRRRNATPGRCCALSDGCGRRLKDSSVPPGFKVPQGSPGGPATEGEPGIAVSRPEKTSYIYPLKYLRFRHPGPRALSDSYSSFREPNQKHGKAEPMVSHDAHPNSGCRNRQSCGRKA
jgi:hypothetical protein